MEKTLYAGFWESLRVMALFLQQSSFLDRLWVFTFASSLRLFFPMQPPRVHPILSPLSHTTPLRCPAFSSSPRSPSRGHVVESTEGPNTQTQQGLTSTSTACLQMELEDRRAGHRGGWGGPRRRQSAKLLEAKRKCRQRARSLHGCLGKSSGCVTIAKSTPCCDFDTAQPVVASCPLPEASNANSMSASAGVR
jgi:hypothetical protein